ncbi:MAG: replicative DNA helicase, partial [Muribaculaceae bacterium]|nr:replicative DNA helicase [Muribaculaceae bacterium]
MPNQNQNNSNRPGRTRPQHESEIVSEMGKLQPQDLPMEEAVLGALMLEKDAYSAVSDLLKPQAFYDPSHQKIYEAIQTLGSMQRPIDMLTVTEQLRANGTLAEVGGPVRISELTGRVSSAANIEFHARIILQKYISRQLIAFSSMVQTKAFDETLDVYDLMQEAEGTLFEISKSTLKRDVVQIDPIISEAIKKIQDAANNESGLSGLQTGYYALDKITGGWQNSDLIIIAARPAMGKTALVLSMAKNMAVDLNTPVAIFSLEMSNLQLVNRLISNVCSLEGEKIKSG